MYDIDPYCEDRFPGIDLMEDELASNNWIYNKTPSFTLMDKKVNTQVTYIVH